MINVINPARTSEVVGQVAESSPAQVDRAVAQAETAFKSWAWVPVEERAARIGAKLSLLSSATSGTEITLVVPGDIAFRMTNRLD